MLSPHPGRVRAELDASKLDFSNVDSPAFGAMTKRIHNLLFGDEHRNAGTHKEATA